MDRRIDGSGDGWRSGFAGRVEVRESRTGRREWPEAGCVADAYGWGDDWRAELLTDDEILARLFRLNQERSGNA